MSDETKTCETCGHWAPARCGYYSNVPFSRLACPCGAWVPRRETPKRCGTCGFWEVGQFEESGFCCARPPVIMPYGDTRPAWPPTLDRDWCGSWTPLGWREEEAPR